MSYITGESEYGDYMEELFYNGAQGARKKDERAIAYLNSPNQFYATTNSSAAMHDMQVYAPCYPVACCPVNAVCVVPEFIRGMILHDTKDNIYVVAYGPCSLNYKDICFREITDYPFRNKVKFVVESDKKFKLFLKIPKWCKGETVTVNKKSFKYNIVDNYIVLDKEWNKGDVVLIDFKAEVEIKTIDDSDYASKYPLAVKYGALVFAYHLPERWEAIPGNPMTKLLKEWSWFNVYPEYEEADVDDPHEQIGLRRNQFSWNVALDENILPEDITIEEIPSNGYVWEKPMIKLHTIGYKAPYMLALYPEKTFETFEKYQYVTEKVSVELVPYGCTNLRLTYFPISLKRMWRRSLSIKI